MKLPRHIVLHLQEMGVKAETVLETLGVWLTTALVGAVPFHTAVRVMDLCLVLGMKALYLVVLAIVLTAVYHYKRASNGLASRLATSLALC